MYCRILDRKQSRSHQTFSSENPLIRYLPYQQLLDTEFWLSLSMPSTVTSFAIGALSAFAVPSIVRCFRLLVAVVSPTIFKAYCSRRCVALVDNGVRLAVSSAGERFAPAKPVCSQLSASSATLCGTGIPVRTSRPGSRGRFLSLLVNHLPARVTSAQPPPASLSAPTTAGHHKPSLGSHHCRQYPWGGRTPAKRPHSPPIPSRVA